MQWFRPAIRLPRRPLVGVDEVLRGLLIFLAGVLPRFRRRECCTATDSRNAAQSSNPASLAMISEPRQVPGADAGRASCPTILIGRLRSLMASAVMGLEQVKTEIVLIITPHGVDMISLILCAIHLN